MATPPLRTEISDTYPLPTNATARTGFGKLYDYVTGLLGSTGNAAEARIALGAAASDSPTLTGTPLAPTASVGTNTTQIATMAAIANVVGTAGAASGRNRIHNSNFQINQLVVSGTVTLAAGAYGHDRWKAGASGCTYTFAASGKDTIITITAGSLMQVIEDKDVEGGVYRLSHAGTAQARIAVNGATTSGAYADTPLSSATATGGQTMTVEFTTGTVSKVQLELGTVATNYERRPYGQELALCQRFFCKTFPQTTAPSQNAGLAGALMCTSYTSGGAGTTWKFPVEMRTTPTIVAYNPLATNGSWRDVTNGVDRATAPSNAIGTTQTDILAAASAAGAAYNYIHATANANL